MRRRDLMGLAGGASIAWPLVAQAQQPRVPRIGMLVGRRNPALDGFAQGLRELGYVEGRNIVIERRDAGGDIERTFALATGLAQLQPDAIYANTAAAAAAVRRATTTIPLVFSMLGDPVAFGWTPDFARPAGNLTGIAGVDTAEIAGKRVELLRDAVPHARRIGLIFTPGSPTSEPAVKGSEAAARALGVELRAFEIDGAGRVEAAFATLRAWRAEALAVAQSQLFATQPLQGRIVELAAEARLPAIYGESDWVDLGGMMSYVPDLFDMGRRAASFVGRILRGAKPAELPIERPARILLRISLRAALAIGVTIPHAMLARADEVIE